MIKLSGFSLSALMVVQCMYLVHIQIFFSNVRSKSLNLVSPQTTQRSCCPDGSTSSFPVPEFGLTIAETSPHDEDAVDSDSELPTRPESLKCLIVVVDRTFLVQVY